MENKKGDSLKYFILFYLNKFFASIIIIVLLMFLSFQDVRNLASEIINKTLINCGFLVEEVKLSKVQNINEIEIRTLIERYVKDQSLLALNLNYIEKSLLAYDWIDKVQIKRSLPHTIEIDIAEHVAIAYFKTEEHFKIINSIGEPIVQLDNINDFANDIPELKGEGALINFVEIIEAIGRNSKYLKQIEIIERVSKRRWNLILRNGIVIKLPNFNIKENWEYFLRFESEFNVLNPEIKSIDLRSKDRFFIEFIKDPKNIRLLK